MAYPVSFDIETPNEFSRAQVALRVLIGIVLSVVFPAMLDTDLVDEFGKAQIALRVLILIVPSMLLIGATVLSAVYLVLPMIAAMFVSQKGAEQYLAKSETSVTKCLHYLLNSYSYMALATDKLPTESPDRVVRLQVQPNGEPTVGSALIRIILAIPHAFVLWLLSFVFAIVWIIAAVSIVINGSYPQWAASFIKGYLRWIARLMVYMASLVDEYPPFSFQNGAGAAPEAGGAEPPADEGGGAPDSEGTG